jgi:hypothetical protein
METWVYLYEKLFFQFKWAERITAEEKERYEEAHRIARKFILNLSPALRSAEGLASVLTHLRQFYRMGQADRLTAKM